MKSRFIATSEDIIIEKKDNAIDSSVKNQVAKNYSPSQKRDSSGKWSKGGSSSYNPYDGKVDLGSLGIEAIPSGGNPYESGKVSTYDVKKDTYLLFENLHGTETFHKGDNPIISKENTQKNMNKLTDAEKLALNGYTSEYGYGSYHHVNDLLRKGTESRHQEPEVKQAAKDIKSALNKVQLGTSTYVYRGVESNIFKDPEIQKAVKLADKISKGGVTKQKVENIRKLNELKGTKITDKAPLSTSPYSTSFFSNREVKITIKTKPTDKALDITSLSRFGGSSIVPSLLGTVKTESEVLYAPDTVFEITDVKVNSSGVNVLMETVLDTKAKNKYDYKQENLIELQHSSLKNQIITIEKNVASVVLNKLAKVKNAFEKQDEIISEKDKEENQRELELALIAYFSVVIPLFAANVMNNRAKEYGLIGSFKLDRAVKNYISELSKNVSESHLNTILNDILSTVKNTYDLEVESQLSKIEMLGRKVTDEDLKLARKLALEGKSQQQIINAVTEEYNSYISKTRASAIARTETNRAFTQSQFHADRQFLEQNGLEGRAYKKWVTTNDKPCATCLYLESQEPIPFERNFANLGDELVTTYEDDGKVKKRSLLINFEPLSAGNAHVNCGCSYVLVIK